MTVQDHGPDHAGHAHAGHADPSNADCADFLERIVRLIDNELEEGDCSVVRAHIDACSPCLERYDLQRTVKSIVHRSCGETAPADLMAKVKVQIQSIRVQITEG